MWGFAYLLVSLWGFIERVCASVWGERIWGWIWSRGYLTSNHAKGREWRKEIGTDQLWPLGSKKHTTLANGAKPEKPGLGSKCIWSLELLPDLWSSVPEGRHSDECHFLLWLFKNCGLEPIFLLLFFLLFFVCVWRMYLAPWTVNFAKMFNKCIRRWLILQKMFDACLPPWFQAPSSMPVN